MRPLEIEDKFQLADEIEVEAVGIIRHKAASQAVDIVSTEKLQREIVDVSSRREESEKGSANVQLGGRHSRKDTPSRSVLS